MMASSNSRHLLKSKAVKLAFGFLLTILLLAILADVITGPGAIIQFEPNAISAQTATYRPPGFTEKTSDGVFIHLLGTDKLGRDVAARLIHGIRAALSIGLLSTLLSLIIAILLGTLSGYYGNRSTKLNLAQIVWLVVSVPLALFYSVQQSYYINSVENYTFSTSQFLIYALVLFAIIAFFAKMIASINVKSYFLPFDTIILKLLEVFRSIPTLFLLLAVFAIVKTPNLLSVVIIIGLLRWQGLTRLLRAEILKTRSEEYIAAAKTLGISNYFIIIKHVLPNSFSPIIVALIFSTSSAVLLESALSFLEIGLPLNTPSWGGMLQEARQYFAAWWLALFPGLLIFFTVLSLNTIGNRLNEMNNKRL